MDSVKETFPSFQLLFGVTQKLALRHFF